MPNRRNAVKKIRVDKKRHQRNLKIKEKLKKTVKKFQAFLAAKNTEEAKKILTTIYSQLDKAAKKQVVPSQRARRRKSRLALQLRKLVTAAGAPS